MMLVIIALRGGLYLKLPPYKLIYEIKTYGLSQMYVISARFNGSTVSMSRIRGDAPENVRNIVTLT